MSITDEEGFLEARYHRGLKDGLAEGEAKRAKERLARVFGKNKRSLVVENVGICLEVWEYFLIFAPKNKQI